MLTCDFAPAAPAGDGDQQDASAIYEAGLFAAWESCYGNLYAVRKAMERWQAIIAEAQAREDEARQ